MFKYIISENIENKGWDIKKQGDDKTSYGHYETAKDALLNAKKRIVYEKCINASLGDKVAFFTFLFSALIFLLKLLSAFMNYSYNVYFSIPQSWDSGFLTDVFSQVMYYGGTIVFLIISNLVIYYFIAYTNIILCILSIILAVLFSSIYPIILLAQKRCSFMMFIELLVVLLIALFCLGICFGISKRIAFAGCKNEERAKKGKQKIPENFRFILVLIFVLILFSLICELGKAFAESKVEFLISVVNNRSMVVLAEKDSKYLLADYEICNGKIKIFTRSYQVIDKDKINNIAYKRFIGNVVENKEFNAVSIEEKKFVSETLK
jgi:hypothetical protein